MKKYLITDIGRLRLIAFLEGISLLILVFAGMPLKYYLQSPGLVKTLGPIHGVLFIAFVILTLQVSITSKWNILKTTAPVLISSFIPFGTFYIDRSLRLMESKGIQPFSVSTPISVYLIKFKSNTCCECPHVGLSIIFLKNTSPC
jgi:integral membrane protein